MGSRCSTWRRRVHDLGISPPVRQSVFNCQIVCARVQRYGHVYGAAFFFLTLGAIKAAADIGEVGLRGVFNVGVDEGHLPGSMLVGI